MKTVSAHRKGERDNHPDALRSAVLAERRRKSEDHAVNPPCPRSDRLIEQ